MSGVSGDLQDGVYVGLPAERYFAQPRLGSSDLKRLHNRPADWWYGSRHNPDKEPETRSEEKDFGSALHCLLLEGEEAFERGFVLSPFDDFRKAEARAWRDATIEAGKLIVTPDMHRRVRHMAALIQNHPEFGPAFAEGLSEVTVLFTWRDLPIRARFDKLLPRFVIDLKTFGGFTPGRDLTDRALKIVAQRHYDVQRFLYDRAREALVELVRDGLLFGADRAEAEWLQRVAREPDWKWVWIFYQRRDDSASNPAAPVVKPIARSRFDASFDSGRRKCEVAVANWRDFNSRFGLSTPWATIEPMTEPPDHAFPPWLADVAAPEHEQPEAEEAA